MSRWRPPAASSTAIITRAGYECLRAEMDELWRVRRPEVVKALAAAAAEGDRSENAEYTYRKKQLGEIDRRVRYLSKRLPSLKVVDSGDGQCYRIVGPDETDARQGWISIDSPLARAMLAKRGDDEFEAVLPAGPQRFVIVAVEYDG